MAIPPLGRPDQWLVDRYREAATLCGVFAAALALIALAGWVTGVGVLRSIVPGTVPMNPATAVAFLLAALPLATLHQTGLRRVGIAAAIAVVALGAIKLIGLAGGPAVGLDRWLFAGSLEEAAGGHPNRMAPNTAACFVGIGVSLALLGADRRPLLAQVLALLVGLSAFVAVAGYIYDIHRLYGVGRFIPMAPNTGVGFFLLSVGAILSRPDRAPVSALTSDGSGGYLARRLLPAAVLVPLLVGWLRSLGERAGLYGTETGIGLMVIACIVILTVLVVWTARLIDRGEKEQARLQRELEVKVRELDVVNRELESFTYAVSHDLRSPLRSIAGFSEAIEEDCADRLDDAGRGHLQRIRAAATRMGRLIDGLLDLSRVTRAPLERQPVDLSSLAAGIMMELGETGPERRVEVEIEPGLRADGDPRLVDVTLRNLVGNAWKYTRDEPSARIEIGSTNGGSDDPGRVFYVRDNGAGFDMAYADKLFGAFQRLHGVDEFEGTGIGLATVQRIVHRHGGRIWAEAKVGEGATFYFTLDDGKEGG